MVSRIWRWETFGRSYGEGRGGGGEETYSHEFRMNHAAFAWGGFHFVTAYAALRFGAPLPAAVPGRQQAEETIRHRDRP